MDREKMDVSERSHGKAERAARAPKNKLQTTRARDGKNRWPKAARRQNQTGGMRLDNTRKLVIAALRLWELKQGIHE